MADNTEIATPAGKALTALGAGAGTSVGSIAASAGKFLPVDLAGWLACAASAGALLYTLTIMTEWWWKRFWRPFFRARGWVKTDPVETGPAPLGPR